MQATLISVLAVMATIGQSSHPIPKDELVYQKQAFEQWWGQELVLHLDDLPAEGKVPEFRVPYSGFDYPDHSGGTLTAMQKYDLAFHRGQMAATEWERRDVGMHRGRFGYRTPDEMPVRLGLFGRIRMAARTPRTPSWYGHCNGWTAAAIRHAEPQYSVTRNGVVFTPADIKGLLAEIYMYSDTEFLGGVDQVIHPAVFHVTLTNWLGRGAHPIGMESAIGEVVINYPIYGYKAKVVRHTDRTAEVAVTTTYAMNTNRETNQPVRYPRQAYYHYQLDLDNDGRIVGGRYYNDSHYVDMLWVPLKPVQGGQKGNERGNPHVNVKEVLALWRASVPETIRNQWLNIDPTEEDRLVFADAESEITPDKSPEEKDSQEKTDEAAVDREPTAAPMTPSPGAVRNAPTEAEVREAIARDAAEEAAANPEAPNRGANGDRPADAGDETPSRENRDPESEPATEAGERDSQGASPVTEGDAAEGNAAVEETEAGANAPAPPVLPGSGVSL